MALVVTLSIVVLLTFLVVAFFSAATAYRAVENTSAGGVTAKILAEGAVGAVQAELVQEITAGSDKTTIGGANIYYPKGGNATFMVPKRAIIDATLLDTNSVNYTNFANLVKQSGQSFYTVPPSTTAPKIFSTASSDSSATPGANGRKIGANRWNTPMLTGAAFATNQVPNWVYITPNGYTNTISTNVIGRVAFNVYDVGGLLNANASGFAPGSGTSFSDEMHRKGSTVWADLRVLPGINPSAFAANTDAWPPQWRLTGDWGTGANGFSFFSTSTNSSASYYERTGWRTAFLNTAGTASDRMFASRQDLIRYAKANSRLAKPIPPNATFEVNSDDIFTALPFLTHWSRWNNAPSFKHDLTRTYTKAVAGNVAAGGNDYSTTAAQQAANPFFPTVRVPAAFQRKRINAAGALVNREGANAMAKVGEALVKYRFPLSRLGMVKRTTTGVAAGSPIHWAFGLTRGNNVSDPWVYSALNASARIASLAEVAAQGREPNFFELLKAAIHAGSLGKASGAGAIVSRDNLDGNLDLQVWRLGANLIDQYDADSFPTIIRLPEGTSWDGTDYLGSGTRNVKIYGIENLPQVQGVTEVWKWTSNKNPSSTPMGGTIIMQPVLWNPHDITTYADPGSGAPTKFRVWASATSLQYHSFAASTSNPNRTNSAVEFTANPAVFREPNLIARRGRDAINAVPVGALASIVDDHPYEWLGSGRTEPAGGLAIPGTVIPGYGFAFYHLSSANGACVYLDYQDTDGAWVTYSALESVPQTGFINYYTGWVSYFAKPDPRTQRFGSFGSQVGGTSSGAFRPEGGYWRYIGTGWPPASGQMASLWDVPPNGPAFVNLGQFNGRGSSGAATNATGMTMNTDGAAFRYTDPDGVLRWGDSGYGANGMLSNETATRPIVLNRAFRSVGEMGYAFRDLPWKSLDFFSERSGDSALLDVFCISESPDDAIVANRVSLNSASDAVIRAMLTEGLRRDAGGAGSSVPADRLSNAELTTIVDAIRTTRNAAPFLNRNELVTRVMAALPRPPTAGTSFTIKRQREAVIRALADVMETRNWNLMVDVIAQSGKLRPGGSTAADFIVEGESRTWDFFSLDRITATVLDQTSEGVGE